MGVRLAQSMENVTLNLRVVSSSSRFGVEPIKKKAEVGDRG